MFWSFFFLLLLLSPCSFCHFSHSCSACFNSHYFCSSGSIPYFQFFFHWLTCEAWVFCHTPFAPKQDLSLFFILNILVLDFCCDNVLGAILCCQSHLLQMIISLYGLSFAAFPVVFCLFSYYYLPLVLCILHQLYCYSFLVFHEQNWHFGKSKPRDYFSIAWGKALSRENSTDRRAKILRLLWKGKLQEGSLQNTSFFHFCLLQDRSAVLLLLMLQYSGVRSLVTGWCAWCASGFIAAVPYLVVWCCRLHMLWVLEHLSLSNRKHLVPGRIFSLCRVKVAHVSMCFSCAFCIRPDF